MRQEHRVAIARPVEEVFAYVDDPAKASEWAEGIVAFEITDEKPGKVGSRYRMVVREGKSDNAYDGEVLAWERNRHRRMSATRGEMTMILDQKFERTPDGGTRLVHSAEVPLKGAMTLVAPLIWLMNRHFLRKQAGKVKEILEREKETAVKVAEG